MYQFKMAIIRKLTFLLSGFQWEIYEKSTEIRGLHGTVACVLHTLFTWNERKCKFKPNFTFIVKNIVNGW